MEGNNFPESFPSSQPSTSGFQFRKKIQSRPSHDFDHATGYLAGGQECPEPAQPQPNYVPRRPAVDFANRSPGDEGAGKESVKAMPTSTLELFTSTLHFYKLPAGKGYFEFVNPKRPESPLRLYRTAMLLLCDKFPLAKVQAKKMEDAGLPNNYRLDVASINKFENQEVILYVEINGGIAYIYLRLHKHTDNGERQPCTYGVRLHTMDCIQELTNFVRENK